MPRLDLAFEGLLQQLRFRSTPSPGFERGAELKERPIEALQRALEAAGVEFIRENGGGPGVRLKKTKRETRKR